MTRATVTRAPHIHTPHLHKLGKLARFMSKSATPTVLPLLCLAACANKYSISFSRPLLVSLSRRDLSPFSSCKLDTTLSTSTVLTLSGSLRSVKHRSMTLQFARMVRGAFFVSFCSLTDSCRGVSNVERLQDLHGVLVLRRAAA